MKIRYAIPLLLALVACDLVGGPDLRSKAAQDVQIVRASDRKLTITDVADGATSPSGVVTLKDGFTVDIEGTAQPESVLIGWKQTGGTGTAEFSPVSTTKVTVKLSGGDAVIEPVYEARPVVLYMTPIGNNIAKNSSVRLVFNREVDLGTGTSPLVSIKKQGTIDVPYDIVAKAGSTSVTFKPQAPSLDDYAQYVVAVKAGVPIKAVFDAANYPGVTFLNTTVTTRTDFNNPFQTGANFDTLPPFGGSFVVASTAGNTFYSPDDNVTLNSIEALDDSGDGGVASLAVRNEADPFPDFPNDFTFDMTLPWQLKANTEGQYTVSMIFKDVNGNAVPATSAAIRTFNIDTTPPAINTFALDSAAAAPGYVSSLSTTFSLAALDPVISGTTTLGSGESLDGSTPSEQKKYRLSNDGTTWTSWTAFAQTGSWNLASGADGTRTVSVQVQDGVGNASPTSTASVMVDTTAPAVSASLAGGKLTTASANVNLVITASDSGSGLAKLNLGTGSTGVQTGSTYTPSLLGTAGSSGTVSGTHTLGASGIAFADGLALVLTSGDGTKHLDVIVKDKLGNSQTAGVDLLLDTTAPTTGSVSINGGITSTNSVSVPITISGSDAGSGVAQMGIQTVEGADPNVNNAVWSNYQTSKTVTLNPVSQGAQQYIYVWFKDNVGLVSVTPASAHLTFSNSAPTATFSLTSASLTSSNLVDVSYTATESTHSGSISKLELSNDGSTWTTLTLGVDYTKPQTYSASGTKTGWDIGLGVTNGTRTIYLRATDQATNTVTKTVNVTYDNTKPTVTLLSLSGSGGAASTNTAGITVSFTLSDNLTPTGSLQYEITSDGGSTWTSLATAATSSVYTGYSLTSPSNGSVTVSVRATDLAGNVSTSASSSILYDSVKPTLSSPSVNAGAAYTTYNLVNLSLSAADGGSGVAYMRFSNDNSAWSGWYTYSTSFANWDFNSATYGGNGNQGTKTVYFQVMDSAGNVSLLTSNSDSIYYDNVAPLANPLTYTAATSQRVVSLTNSVTESGSGTYQMQTWSDGHYGNWVTYAPTVQVLLTPQNGTKSVYVHYKDNAGNISGWAGPATFTLNEIWGNLSSGGRAELVGSNYTDPASNNHAAYSTGTHPEDTTFLGTSSPLNLTSGSQGQRSYVFLSNGGQIGMFDYYLSGTTIQFYYRTFNSSDNAINGSWTYASTSLSVVGSYFYLDIDNAAWNGTTTYNSNQDFYIQNVAGTFYLYLTGSTLMKYALF